MFINLQIIIFFYIRIRYLSEGRIFSIFQYLLRSFTVITVYFQIALNNGHREGTGAVYVGIHRNKENIKSNKDPVIFFKVEPGETWVLFPGVGEHIRHGKTKRKMFRKTQQKWVTEDDQDRDPHACLKKG